MGRRFDYDFSDRPIPEITSWVQEHCTPDKARCHCGRDLRGDTVWGYHHYRGWRTQYGLMWLFIRCPVCRYEMALWKMGIPQNTDFWEESDLGNGAPAEARS
jgi:hypothetical protein